MRRSKFTHNLLPAIIIAVITCAALITNALTLSQHGDERLYIWKAAYFTSIPWEAGPNPYLTPGSDPFSFWALEQPFGSHLLYAAAMRLFSVPAPMLPYSFTDQGLKGAETAIPRVTLPVVRLIAVMAAALGLAFFVFRMGWRAFLACCLFLLIPHVREDLARAWAESPLLLGFGLCALTYGSPWFVPAVGLATGFKLSAIVLWPVIWFQPPIKFKYLRSVLNIIVTAFVFSLTTPYSWFAGGPAYLVFLWIYRVQAFIRQSSRFPTIAGLFIPTRYLWPLELALCLAAVFYLPDYLNWLVSRIRRARA